MDYEFQIDSVKYIFNGNTMELYKDKNISRNEIVCETKTDTLIADKVTFLVTDKCNGNCKYCYETLGNSCMDIANAEQSILWLVNKYKKIRNINFFGGEPLINFSLIQYIVENLKKRICVEQYSVITNAILLTDEMLEYFEINNFKIIVSFDGPEYIHNKLRPKCPHSKVLDAIKKIQKSLIGNLLEVNCTYTKYHAEEIGIEELEKYFKKLNIDKFHISNVITEDRNLKLPISNIETQKKLLETFYKHTGVPMLCNTSLNDKGEPIIDKISELFNFALRKNIKIAYINGERFELKNHSEYNKINPEARYSWYQKKIEEKDVNPYNLRYEEIEYYLFNPQLQLYDITKKGEVKQIREIIKELGVCQ